MNRWQLERDSLLRRWYGRISRPDRIYGRAWPDPIKRSDYLEVPKPAYLPASVHIHCLVWRGRLSTAGYGHLLLEGKSLLAHRTAYLQACGPLDDNIHLRHVCGRPYCIQPAHMYTGKPLPPPDTTPSPLHYPALLAAQPRPTPAATVRNLLAGLQTSGLSPPHIHRMPTHTNHEGDKTLQHRPRSIGASVAPPCYHSPDINHTIKERPTHDPEKQDHARILASKKSRP